jgi:hypothetical protein
MSLRNGSLSSVVLRLGLGLGFLSAVADRFGLWGAFGRPKKSSWVFLSSSAGTHVSPRG